MRIRRNFAIGIFYGRSALFPEMNASHVRRRGQRGGRPAFLIGYFTQVTQAVGKNEKLQSAETQESQSGIAQVFITFPSTAPAYRYSSNTEAGP